MHETSDSTRRIYETPSAVPDPDVYVCLATASKGLQRPEQCGDLLEVLGRSYAQRVRPLEHLQPDTAAVDAPAAHAPPGPPLG